MIPNSQSNYSTPYTLYAYGPGIAGTFMSQRLMGMAPDSGNVTPPLEVDVLSPERAITVTTGNNDLGVITWTANRVGPTVFELGVPDRKAGEFRHGEDFWAPQVTTTPGYPTGIWGGQMFFNFEYPSMVVNYTVGTSRWATDWNYVLPSQQAPLPTVGVKNDATFLDASGVITFNLANAPSSNEQASIYLAAAGDNSGTPRENITIKVNGTTLDPSSIPGLTAAPNPITSGSFGPPKPYTDKGYVDDSSVHLSDHGPFFDERITFPAGLLHAGSNTLTILNHAESSEGYLMVDYLRLELTNYIPPPPVSVQAYPGNNRNLITWPIVPGATRYAVLRSTSPDSGYTTLAAGVLGTVSGSGPGIMTYTDTTALNNTNYYYEIESLNPKGPSAQGASAPSVRSGRATPSPALSTGVPATPTSLAVNGFGDGVISLKWNTGTDANYCNIYRTTLHANGVKGNDGVEGTYPLRTVLMQDGIVNDRGIYNFTDATASNGTTYSYYVQAVNAAGTSSATASVQGHAGTSPPDVSSRSLTAARSTSMSVLLSWNAVPNATGYAIYRSTSPGGPFTFPDNLLNGTSVLFYIDNTVAAGTTYYYQVTAVNVTGISPASTVTAAP